MWDLPHTDLLLGGLSLVLWHHGTVVKTIFCPSVLENVGSSPEGKEWKEVRLDADAVRRVSEDR